MTIELAGRIDSTNAAQVEEQISAQLAAANIDSETPLELDAAQLDYISSSGLRILLRIRKRNPNLRIFNVKPEIYDILEMTGFTEMMPVTRAYRNVSIDGCEEIGHGANGSIYRIDQDNVVKVYKNADALEDIRHEREVAKLALILGIPTAISYDVVRVGNSYGSVFELLNARSFSNILADEPEKFDWCVTEFVNMLRKIHSTVVPDGKLPDMKETVLSWVRFMQDYLPEAAWNKLLSLVEAVPHDDHMLHGDYHTKNLQLQGDEVLLIDMDTLAVGNPIFELASMYNSFVGFSEWDHNITQKFLGFDAETGKRFWRETLAAYLETGNERKLKEVEDKARIIGYTRMIRRSIRRKGLETEARRAEIDLWTSELLELLEATDTLLFNRNELLLEATDGNLVEVQAFIEEHLAAAKCSKKKQLEIDVAVEEIFVNISHYAYAPGTGNALVRVELKPDLTTAVITFADHGIPYNPMEKKDPDVTLPADRREIGGLGIYMTKELMDSVTYEYRDGQNILTMKKNL